ncbi:MAG TPA: HAMP domain-containing sensor histidine kinase [Polyangiaceae bacterium]|nr:HAMP domain-containing sensor histidine kinase [Polyangiaceae bacterium]
MTLHARLVTAVTVLSVVLLGAAFTIVWLFVRASQQEQLDIDLRSEAVEVAHEVAVRGGRELVLGDQPNDDGAIISKYGVVYGADGAATAWTSNMNGRIPALATFRAPRGKSFDFLVGSEHVRGILVDVPGRTGSVLLIAASRDDLDGDSNYLARALLFAFASVVLLTALLAARIVRRFTRDYESIADVTRRVAEGDLSARVRNIVGDREIAKLQANINTMIERLDVLLTSHRRFVAYAAHELRSPLTTLYGELSLALRRPRTVEAYRFAIEEALDAARRLKLLAEDLLALARLDAGSEEPWTWVRLPEVLSNVVMTVASEAQNREVALDVQSMNIAVRTRGTELERMIRNLTENAVKHSPPRGTVRVRASCESDRIVIEVIDSGHGVDESNRTRIFEPFWRAPDQQASGAAGAGLGLAIAQQIARAHGGDVEVDAPASGTGAIFRVMLPLLESSGGGAGPASERPTHAGSNDITN